MAFFFFIAFKSFPLQPPNLSRVYNGPLLLNSDILKVISHSPFWKLLKTSNQETPLSSICYLANSQLKSWQMNFHVLSKRGQYNIYIWSLWPLESHFRHVQLIFLNCSNSRIFSFLSCIFIKMQFLIFNANASLGSIRSLRKLKAIKIILLKSPNWFQIVLLASMLLF